jgi:hypothetical protein
MEEKTKDDNSLAVWGDFRTNQRALTKRLGVMIVNGKKLSDIEINALAAYSMTNDLNPFNGECYYMPGLGPTPGIAGWRKKAQEQLEWEAKNSNEIGAHYWVEYTKAEQNEARFDPTKDVAWKVILRDWLSNKKWRQAVFEAMRELKEVGVDKPYEEALKLVGTEPTWTGIGVVTSTENFGNDKMDRNERAKKRAEKIALRKRFPRIELPDMDYEPEDVIDVIPTVENPNKITSESEILDQLGYKKEENIDALQEIKDKIITICNEKGGADNQKIMDLIKEYDPKGNPNRIKDLSKLEELYKKLFELN